MGVNVEIKIDSSCTEPTVIIRANALTQQVADLAELLRDYGADGSKPLIGLREEKLYLLQLDDIRTIYTEDQKVYARGDSGIFLLRHRLYELEAMLGGAGFVRISHSEIVHFSKVESLDMSISGTITLRLKTGETCFVSRRYVDKIKQYLGL